MVQNDIKHFFNDVAFITSYRKITLWNNCLGEGARP